MDTSPKKIYKWTRENADATTRDQGKQYNIKILYTHYNG